MVKLWTKFYFPGLILEKFLVFRSMIFFFYIDFVSYYFGNHFRVGEGDGRWGVGELGSGKWEWGMEGFW